MTCRPWRWLWGLIPLALIAFLAIVGERARIERDLGRRAQLILDQGGLRWAEARFEGRDAIIAGRAASEPERAKAAEVLRRGFGVRVVSDQATLVQFVKAYFWSASRDEDRIKLKGFVPSDAEHEAIIGMARASFPGFKILDRMKLARGAPPSDLLLGGASFGLKQLHRLKEGRVALLGTKFEIHGRASDSASYRAVRSAVTHNLPAGLTLKVDAMRPAIVSPYRWSVTFKNKTLSLNGFVPSEKARALIVAQARGHLRQKGRVIDQQEIAEGTPKGWEQAVLALIERLSRLEYGQASLVGDHIEFEATARDQDSAEAMVAELAESVPSRFGLKPRIAFIKPRPKTVRPYKWSARLGNDRLTLEGYFPSEQASRELLDVARKTFPALAIDNRMSEARGAPDAGRWRAAVDFALARLAELEQGEVALIGLEMKIAGAARTTGSYGHVKGALRGPLPKGLNITARRIEPATVRPYVWSARIEGNGLTVSGHVPSERLRRALTDDAKARFPSGHFTDRMLVAKGAPVSPEHWLTTARAGLAAIILLGNGRANLDDQRLTVAAKTSEKGLYDQARKILTTSIASGYTSHDRLTYVPPKEPDLEWTATRDGATLVLAGEVPSAGVRKALDERAKILFPDLKLIDETRLARGHEPLWLASATVGLGLLARLRSGEAKLERQALSITGQARDAATREVIHETLISQMPKSYSGRGFIEIMPEPVNAAREIEELVDQWARERVPTRDPYPWRAELTAAKLVLAGSTPSPELHDKIRARAAALFPGHEIVDEMTPARGAPDKFFAMIETGLENLARLEYGQVTLSGRKMALSGMAEGQETVDEIRAGLAKGNGAAAEISSNVRFRHARIPTVRPYRWSAELSPDRLLLTGYVPDEPARKFLHAVAIERFAGTTVVDGVVIARGAPERFTDAVRTALHQLSRLEHGRAHLENRDLELTGTADRQEDVEVITRSLSRQIPRGLRPRAELHYKRPSVATASPYVWSVTRRSGDLVLAGHVPSASARDFLLALVRERFAGLDVKNNMSLARGQPGGFRKIASIAIEQLSKLTGGRAILSDLNLDFAGRAGEVAAADAVRTALAGALPRTVALREELEVPAPATAPTSPAAGRDGRGDRETATVTDTAGTGDGGQGRQRLEETAGKNAAPRQGETAPAPAGGVVAHTSLLADLGAMAPAPGSGQGDEMKPSKPIKAAVCGALMKNSARTGRIGFATGSSELTPDSTATLNSLTRIAKRCPKTIIEIFGHTDSVGTELSNKLLSNARALSVAQYMTKKGIARQRLITKGLGEKYPIAPNDTPDNKARNRRIEFAVKPMPR